jgi:hypothetical protein
MNIEISKGNDGQIEASIDRNSLHLNCIKDWNNKLFTRIFDDNAQLTAQGFPHAVIEGNGSISGRGHARGTGTFDGTGAVFGDGTVTGTGIVIRRNRNGNFEVQHGTGTVTGGGFVFGTGHGSGTIEHSRGSGTVSGTGRVRHRRF